MPAHPLDHLVRLSGVTDAVAEARQACEELRWHRALRKQWPVARAEAGVRCAHAGLALDGVRVPRSLVRDVARGAAEPPAGPEGDAVVAALRVQSEVE
ncbi:MAG TPA: cell filamentation protein Fic, partial [Actinotalea sp.]